MSVYTVAVQIPDELLQLGFSDDEIRRELPVLLVLKRFRQSRISSSKAASMLGLTRREFLDLLAREGIPFFEPSAEQLADEFKTVQQLGPA